MDERLATQVEGIVLRRLAEDKMLLPAMPAVATKCLEALRHPEFSFKSIASILEQDPVLATRILRSATSAAFAGGSKNPTLVEALSRLGAKSVRTCLIDACASTVFVSTDPKIAHAAKRVWQHSVVVGVLARDISALTGSKDSDSAYLAGLLHDIGKPIVGSILLEAERQVRAVSNKPWITSADWTAVVQRTQRRVGKALAEKWELAAPISKCIADCSEYEPADRAAITNAVCLANALSKQMGMGADDSGIEDAKALVMIGRSVLGTNDDELNAIVSAARTRFAGGDAAA